MQHFHHFHRKLSLRSSSNVPEAAAGCWNAQLVCESLSLVRRRQTSPDTCNQRRISSRGAEEVESSKLSRRRHGEVGGDTSFVPIFPFPSHLTNSFFFLFFFFTMFVSTLISQRAATRRACLFSHMIYSLARPCSCTQ